MDSENSSTNKLLGKRVLLLHDTKGFDNPELTGKETILLAGSNCLFIRAFLNKTKTIIAHLLHSDGNQYYVRHAYDQLESLDVTQIKQIATLQALIQINRFLEVNKQSGEDLLQKPISPETKLEISGAVKMITTLMDSLIELSELHKIKDAYLRQTKGPQK